MTRISAGSYSGAQINQGQTIDIVLNSNGADIEKHDNESFKGEDVFYRKDAGKLVSYFVKGTSFKSGQDVQTGFKSDVPVALYMNTATEGKGFGGQIISSGTTKLTFYSPGISSVRLEGSILPKVNSGSNWVMVNIPEGTYEIELLGVPRI